LCLPAADKAIDLVDEAAAKLKMEITSKPLALDEVDRKVLQLEMEKLSLQKAADSDRGARQRLQGLDAQLNALKEQQAKLAAMWEEERDEMSKVQQLKGEIDRVNIEIQVRGHDAGDDQGLCGTWVGFFLHRAQLLALPLPMHSWLYGFYQPSNSI
jgi:ATP-dependent Clp protease ATP-binding subunit ClpA